MNRRSIVAKSGILVAILGVSQANAQSPTPVLACGLEVYASPTGFPEPDPELLTTTVPTPNLLGDPCLDGELVIDPARFVRGSGTPELEMVGFTLDADADVCVTSMASAKGKSFMYLDGARIADPEDFDDGFEEQTHSLAAGAHGLGIRAVGKPGEFVDVEIRQLTNGGGGDPDLPAPGEIRIDPATGALDMVNADGSVRLQNVASDHPLLTPNGDGHHDTTVLQALTTPLVPLPGKDDGSVEYFVDWEFQITDLATCNTIDTGLSGSEQINSPTLITVTWDGLDSDFEPYPDGNYAYHFDANVVNGDGDLFGRITGPRIGQMIDSNTVPANYYDESAERIIPLCDVAADPSNCQCPGVGDNPGPADPNCRFSFVVDLTPGFPGAEGFPPNFYHNEFVEFYNPALFLDLSFITTTLNTVTGRYTVTVDLRNYNAGGLVPKGLAFWPNEAALRQWVSDMTGVPVGAGDGLFNFDYIQIGTSTPVNLFGHSNHSFNHFFLDAMTDDTGRIFVGSALTLLSGLINNDSAAPDQYVVAGREGDECTSSGNTDGDNDLRGKFCAYNTAARIGDVTDLGIYTLRTTAFDFQFNTKLSEQDILCVTDGINTCGVRTIAVPAETIEIESSYYAEGAADPVFTRTETTQFSDATGASVTVDRSDGDGRCLFEGGRGPRRARGTHGCCRWFGARQLHHQRHFLITACHQAEIEYASLSSHSGSENGKLNLHPLLLFRAGGSRAIECNSGVYSGKQRATGQTRASERAKRCGGAAARCRHVVCKRYALCFRLCSPG